MRTELCTSEINEQLLGSVYICVYRQLNYRLT